MEDLLDWLQKVYTEDFCDGSWEHEHGFTITNIDNPGWDFRFELIDTDIENITFEEILVPISDTDWYHCRIKDKVFEGWGGAKNLTDIVTAFKEWYEYASLIANEKK